MKTLIVLAEICWTLPEEDTYTSDNPLITCQLWREREGDREKKQVLIGTWTRERQFIICLLFDGGIFIVPHLVHEPSHPNIVFCDKQGTLGYYSNPDPPGTISLHYSSTPQKPVYHTQIKTSADQNKFKILHLALYLSKSFTGKYRLLNLFILKRRWVSLADKMPIQHWIPIVSQECKVRIDILTLPVFTIEI